MGRVTKEELDAWTRDGRLCFVRQGRVFDVTDFAGRHPGGERPLLNNVGRDVTALMTRASPHRHSSNAYKIMEAYCVGEYEVHAVHIVLYLGWILKVWYW